MYPLRKIFIFYRFQASHQPMCPVHWAARAQWCQSVPSEKSARKCDFRVFFTVHLFTKGYREKLRKRACTSSSGTIVHCIPTHHAQCIGYLGQSGPNGIQVKIWAWRQILGQKRAFEIFVKQCKKSLNVPLTKNFHLVPVPSISSTKVPSVLGTSGIMPPRDSK